MISRTKSAFTLLELLLAISILGILAAIVLTAVNPVHQLAMTKDADRRNGVSEIRRATIQYLIDNQKYPVTVKDQNHLYDICNTGEREGTLTGSADSSCGKFLDMSRLVSTYIVAIPRDPSKAKNAGDVSYRIAINDASGVYVEAPETEIGEGTLRQIIHSGRPPAGYTIPTVENVIGTQVENKVVALSESTYSASFSWLKFLIILGVCLVVWYFVHYRSKVNLQKRLTRASSTFKQYEEPEEKK